MKTEEAKGWGIRVGGPRPYLAYHVFHSTKEQVQSRCTEDYHKPVKVVLVPLSEWRRLKRIEKYGDA